MNNTANTLAEVHSYEPADTAGPAYLAGTVECSCEDAACCNSCEGGYIRVELFGPEAESAYAAWEREHARAAWRQEARDSIQRCYELAGKAIAFARVHDLDGNARGKAACVARAHELRGTVRTIRARMQGAA